MLKAAFAATVCLLTTGCVLSISPAYSPMASRELRPPLYQVFVAPQDGDLNVRTFGAVGNGLADDTAAFQAAIDAAATTRRRKVIVPAGQYRIADGIVLKQSVALVGAGKNISMLQAISRKRSCVTMQARSELHDLTIVYPEQANTAALVAYPAAIIDDQEYGMSYCVVRGVRFVDCYIAISIGQNAASASFVRILDCDGWVLRHFLLADRMNDTLQISGLHLNANIIGTPDVEKLLWVFRNGEVFRLGHVDHIIISDVCVFGYAIGLKLVGGAPSGSANMVDVSGVLFDVCREGINLINHDHGISFVNCVFTGAVGHLGESDAGNSIAGGPGSDQYVQFSNCTFRRHAASSIQIATNVRFSNCVFEDYVAGGTEAAAAAITGSQIKAFFSNCKFNGRMRPGSRGISSERAGAGTYIAVSSSQFENNLRGDIFQADFDLWISATNTPGGFFRNGVAGTMQENEQAIEAKPAKGRWKKGSRFLASTPADSVLAWWVCKEDGEPGVWVRVDAIEAIP